MRKLTILFCLMAIFVACNKEQRHSNKLIKGEKWAVKDVSIDGKGLGQFGEWKILSDEDIFNAVPQAEWKAEGGKTVFEWQFQDKGKLFQLNYLQLCEECDGEDLSELDYLAYKLTGTYEVIRHGKNKMEFSTTETIGYSSKKVRISIERIK